MESFEIDDADRYSLALLCKATSDVALDSIWRQVDGLVPLFKILVPLVPQELNQLVPILVRILLLPNSHLTHIYNRIWNGIQLQRNGNGS